MCVEIEGIDGSEWTGTPWWTGSWLMWTCGQDAASQDWHVDGRKGMTAVYVVVFFSCWQICYGVNIDEVMVLGDGSHRFGFVTCSLHVFACDMICADLNTYLWLLLYLGDTFCAGYCVIVSSEIWTVFLCARAS